MENPTESVLGDDGTACVAIRGEVDFSNADVVARALRDAVAGWSPQVLQVDLRAATFIDSTGLGALIAGYRAAIEHDIRFVVTDPSPAFRRVLTVTGLCELFGVVDQDERTDASVTSATGG